MLSALIIFAPRAISVTKKARSSSDALPIAYAPCTVSLQPASAGLGTYAISYGSLKKTGPG